MPKAGRGTPPPGRKVFIDGEAGTTGLEIRRRLASVPEIEILSLGSMERKEKAARQRLMAEVEAVVLCLPDEAARESVALAEELGTAAPRLLDASTAHRTASGWVYGFPEMIPGQEEAIRDAARVANPGCYATGAIALLRPLIEAGLIPRDFPLTINAVSGYSGGGRTMIEQYENGKAPAFELYGLALTHKHLPEIVRYSGLADEPVFVPSVGNFRQGMLVSVPLHLDALPSKPQAADLAEALASHYRRWPNIPVFFNGPSRLDALGANGSDRLEIYVWGGARHHGRALLVARLDNLGKGAAGAAVENIRLMLGLGRPHSLQAAHEAPQRLQEPGQALL